MSGQIYFSLLNPAITAIFAAVFLFLWKRWQQRGQLLLLAASFTLASVGFAFYDLSPIPNEQLARLVSNFSFVMAIALMCAAAFVRAELRVPIRQYVVIIAATAGAFCWFLFIDDSVTARIIILGLSLGALALLVAVAMTRLGAKTSSDKLILTAAWLGVILPLIRPALAFAGILSPDDGATIQQSSYWLTIQAFSPIVTGTIALCFLGALGLDTLDQMANVANSDYLSGLLTRRGFEAAANKALEAEYGRAGIILADIDNFKSINDRLGHKTGDAVIAAVARAMSSNGGADCAARIGGEEFALFYRDADIDLLKDKAETIRQALGRASIVGLPKDEVVTISIGIHLRRAEQGLSEMLSDADRALYRAKEAGKDRAELSTPSLHSIAG